MKQSLPFVSILVLNWNGKRYIDSFFDSVASQDYGLKNLEVIFIDNGSTDDSVRYFLSKKYPFARLVETGANLGYAGGNNYGFKEAKGDYIVVCNNDLRLAKNWLSNLIEAAKETHADVIVPKLVYENTDIINNAGSILIPDSDWPNLERGINQSNNLPEFSKRATVTAFCGASPLFKRSFLKNVGLFDKNFFLYWEDNDLSWRGQKKGKTYVYEPSAVAYHDASGSTGGEASPIFNHYVSRNRILVLVKNGRLRYVVKAFLKVTRDHVLWKIKDLFVSIARRSGRKHAAIALWRGVKIIADALRLTPIMLAKRWKIIREDTL